MKHPSSLGALHAAAFVLAVDSSSAGHLLPALQAATEAPLRGASWLVSAYMIGALLGAPLLARRAATGGRLRVLAGSMTSFALASLIVAVSSSFPLTVAARFAQGVSGSGVVPLAAAHVSETVEEGKRGRVVGAISLAYSAGFVVGIATVSLFLLASFRVAYVASTVAAGAVAFSLWRRAGDARPRGERVPVGNLVPWAIALTVAAYAVSTATVPRGTLGADGASFALGAARIAAVPLVGWFLWADARSTAPLLPRGYFRTRRGAAVSMLAALAGLGQAAVVVLPTYSVDVLGVSPAASGPMLAPVVVGGVGASALASARLDRWGARPFVAAGAAGIVAGTALVALRGGSLIGFEIAALLIGASVGLLSSGALRVLVMSGGEAREADARQAAVSLLTNVGLLLGGALWGAASGLGHAADERARLGFLTLCAAAIPFAFGPILLESRLRTDALMATVPGDNPPGVGP